MQSLWKSLIPGARLSAEDDLLNSVPLFEELSARELDAVRRLLHRREYVAGESIFVQGEPGLGMYIIARGEVSIQSEPTGRELVALTQGHFFGEIALLNEVIRTATARAATDCTLLSLFQPDLLGLLDRNPRLGVKILIALTRLVGLRLVEVSDEVGALCRQRDALQAEIERLGGKPASGTGEALADAGRLE
ncbi:MAG: cyclic nucleotide-binding domain-containing protein [Bacteroidota bacterium]